MSRAEVLALIPARGGSKGVPGKNVLPIHGKPLIAYSIEHALRSRRVTRTVVSTDHADIARVALSHGAEVPFTRPDAIAQDDSTDLEVFQHALIWLKEHEGYEPALVVHLRPTEPVRESRVIDDAIALMLSRPDADALRSVSEAAASPYKMWKKHGDELVPLLPLAGFPEAHSMPRQRLPPAYQQNGYVDIVRPATILDKKSICGDRVLGFLIEGPVPGIDYPEHIAVLEAALKDRAPC